MRISDARYEVAGEFYFENPRSDASYVIDLVTKIYDRLTNETLREEGNDARRTTTCELEFMLLHPPWKQSTRNLRDDVSLEYLECTIPYTLNETRLSSSRHEVD